MTREEVARVIPLLNGAPQLMVKLLYGSGLRIMEARPRVQDCGNLDFANTLSAVEVPRIHSSIENDPRHSHSLSRSRKKSMTKVMCLRMAAVAASGSRLRIASTMDSCCSMTRSRLDGSE
ncbi:hypothetical protein DSTSK_39330 [Desulforhabdus sp. TSK]|nr:hypothetical protein DSTSK_39330 [Desulforhabdus sp. TSK]